MIIADGLKPVYPISVPKAELEDRDSTVLYAAKELRYYLDRMTSASFQIDEAGSGSVIVVSRDENMGLEEFSVRADGSKIEIKGGNRGVIYGVYDFLEKLGCRFFTSECEKIPTVKTLDVPMLDYSDRPVFEYREHNYFDVTNYPRFAVRCRYNGGSNNIPKKFGSCNKYALYVHTFNTLVPPWEYADEHPEYYSERDGVRQARKDGVTQLCLTNPDVLRITVESVRKSLKEHPDAKIISISQNDNIYNCTCEKCRKVDEEEHSSSGTLLRFVNAVAEQLEDEFPDVVFDTLAYNYSRPAPKYVRNRKNVCVRLCSIECCFSHPFDKCGDTRTVTRPDGTKATFYSDLQDWSRICDRMYIWDYVTFFSHYAAPFANWRVLQPNLQILYRNNVKGVYEEGNWASKGGVDFNELRNYLIAKLLWNPFCDIEKHKNEFIDFYYGDAAEYIKEYLNLLCDTCEKNNDHIGFNDRLTHSYMSEEMLDKYDTVFDKAAEAVKGDAVRLWRIEKNRLSIRYTRLKRDIMLNGHYDAEAINRFHEDWRNFGLSRYDEWSSVETSHRAMIEGKWRGVEYFAHHWDEEWEYY